MKRLFFALLIAGAFCGCDPQTTSVGDQKPVAPDQYQTTTSDKTDPQLPPMVPHWKEK